MKRVIKAFFMGLGMFTALPCPYRPWDEDARELMLACLPVVGALLGLLWTLLALLAWRLLPGVAPALTVLLPWLLTGGIHLDGFLDTCDAILCWRPLEQRLRILKDPRVGGFAVIGFGALALLSYDAARAIADAADLRALLFVPVVSRCCSAFCVLTLKPLRHSEYAASKGVPAQRLALGLMWLIAVIACGVWLKGLLWVPVVETLAYAAAMLWASRTLKGVSGDVAGFALCVAECAALVALSA